VFIGGFKKIVLINRPKFHFFWQRKHRLATFINHESKDDSLYILHRFRVLGLQSVDEALFEDTENGFPSSQEGNNSKKNCTVLKAPK